MHGEGKADRARLGAGMHMREINFYPAAKATATDLLAR